MLKCSSERWVWAPHSLSAGTLTSPRLSVSLRTSATEHLFCYRRDSSTTSVVRPRPSQRLDRAMMLLVVDTATLGGLADPRLLARHGRAGGLTDQRDQAIERLLAVALLAALSLRHQHDDAVARQPAPRKAFKPVAHIV